MVASDWDMKQINKLTCVGWVLSEVWNHSQHAVTGWGRFLLRCETAVNKLALIGGICLRCETQSTSWHLVVASAWGVKPQSTSWHLVVASVWGVKQLSTQWHFMVALSCESSLHVADCWQNGRWQFVNLIFVGYKYEVLYNQTSYCCWLE